MKMKYFLIGFYIVLFCLLVIVTALFFIFHGSKGSFIPLKTDNNETVLVGPEYKSISDSLVTTVNKQNPQAAITQLEEEMQKNPKVLASCHELLHAIGRASYDKYNNFAEAM